MRHEGRCHCGAVAITFESAQDPAAIPLRNCACSFCRLHGVTAVTDPAGRLELRVPHPERVSRYQFGLRASEFYICRECGVYVAAVATIDGASYASLNANVLLDRAAFTQPPLPVDYGRENAVERRARRRRAWTPAVVRS
jgi:hypothetical protein